MKCHFRYALAPSSAAVTLHLFKTTNGTPRGTATGPRTTSAGGSPNSSDIAICLPLEDAFPAAIRIANKHDVEVIVSGEAGLWQAAWGELLTEREPGSDCAITAANEVRSSP